MASNNTNAKKMNKKPEEPSNVQKLLASLQQAQNKVIGETSEPSTSKPKKHEKRKKNFEEKRKTKTGSVGARMQQQAENARMQAKRPRHISSSKSGARNPSGLDYSQQPTTQHQQHRGPRIPADILDELEFRFISNMVDYEINDDIRVCFHLELAHWYYIDHMVEDDKYTNCPNVGSRDFTVQMCQHCSVLRKYAHRADEVIAKFREYKSTVPTYGAILIEPEMEYVLLVQSYFSKGNNWGFPKGKINQNEPPRDAAIRETFEETGYDFGINSEREKKFQRFINDILVRLYLVKNVPKDFNFQPQTRKEIRKIEWFKIADLPTDKTDEIPAYLHGNKFFMVIPFVKDIQLYVQKEKEKMKRRKVETRNMNVASPKQTPAQSSVLSQLFSTTTQTNPPTHPVYKRLTSEELLSAFKKQENESSSTIARPTLPEMSPAVNGLDSLAVLGICTPLKPGASLNQFSASESCPMISEEISSPKQIFSSDTEAEIGFAMPTDLKQPVVTTDHPWQHNKSSESNAAPPELVSHQGWLDTQLVNTIMQSPNPPIPSSNSPATPTTVLGHLIGKPIQPQAIFPQAATPTAFGSAEKPKSSRINLSDNSAFKAINSSQKQSVPKATAPPGSTKTRSASLSGSQKTDNRKAARNLFNSVTSPVSSGDPEYGDEPSMWEEVWFREQFAATAGTSISSLAASNQELAMINRETPIEDRNPSMKIVYQKLPNQLKQDLIPNCQQWTKRIQFDTEFIAGPLSLWTQQFSLKDKTLSAENNVLKRRETEEFSYQSK
uniref:mRNA-decapping enzyme 2 n=1 Tax=Caenorhabditis tropicalis TaxID=1561998 RepID=A0A1I7TE16_9PELO